jgi:hypothetical protein
LRFAAELVRAEGDETGHAGRGEPLFSTTGKAIGEEVRGGATIAHGLAADRFAGGLDGVPGGEGALRGDLGGGVGDALEARGALGVVVTRLGCGPTATAIVGAGDDGEGEDHERSKQSGDVHDEFFLESAP